MSIHYGMFSASDSYVCTCCNRESPAIGARKIPPSGAKCPILFLILIQNQLFLNKSVGTLIAYITPELATSHRTMADNDSLQFRTFITGNPA